MAITLDGTSGVTYPDDVTAKRAEARMAII